MITKLFLFFFLLVTIGIALYWVVAFVRWIIRTIRTKRAIVVMVLPYMNGYLSHSKRGLFYYPYNPGDINLWIDHGRYIVINRLYVGGNTLQREGTQEL